MNVLVVVLIVIVILVVIAKAMRSATAQALREREEMAERARRHGWSFEAADGDKRYALRGRTADVEWIVTARVIRSPARGDSDSRIEYITRFCTSDTEGTALDAMVIPTRIYPSYRKLLDNFVSRFVLSSLGRNTGEAAQLHVLRAGRVLEPPGGVTPPYTIVAIPGTAADHLWSAPLQRALEAWHETAQPVARDSVLVRISGQHVDAAASMILTLREAELLIGIGVSAALSVRKLSAAQP